MVVDKYRGDDDKNFESSMQILTDEFYKWRDSDKNMLLLAQEVFYPYYHAKGTVNITEKTITYHHFQKTWIDNSLPKISILIPTLWRPEWLKRCLDSVNNLIYPKSRLEVLVEEDSPRMWVAKRLNSLFSRCSGDYVVFLSNDTEIAPMALQEAVKEAREWWFDMISFNTWELLPDEGNFNEHFLIKSDFVNKYLSGKIFCEEFNHIWTDNLLLAQVRKYWKVKRSKVANITHFHFSTKKSEFDEVYKTWWEHVEEDRLKLANKLEELSKIT